MQPKAGYKTTEFWVSLLTTIGALTASATSVLPEKFAALVAAVSTFAYAFSRGLAKLASPPSLDGAAQLPPIEPPA
jgi:hypothetical protein